MEVFYVENSVVPTKKEETEKVEQQELKMVIVPLYLANIKAKELSYK